MEAIPDSFRHSRPSNSPGQKNLTLFVRYSWIWVVTLDLTTIYTNIHKIAHFSPRMNTGYRKKNQALRAKLDSMKKKRRFAPVNTHGNNVFWGGKVLYNDHPNFLVIKGRSDTYAMTFDIDSLYIKDRVLYNDEELKKENLFRLYQAGYVQIHSKPVMMQNTDNEITETETETDMEN